MKKVTLLFYFIFLQLLYSNAQLDIHWAYSYGGSNMELGKSIQQTEDGGYIIGGVTESNDGDVTGNNGSADSWLVKVDKLGITEWQKCYGGSSSEYANSIQQTTDGGYIIASDTQSNDGDVFGNHGGSDYWIVKIDSIGTIEWQNCYGGSMHDFVHYINKTTDGGYVIAGYSSSNDGDVSGNHGGEDSWVVKLDAFGNLEWQNSYGGSSTDRATSIQQTEDGGYIMGGVTNSNDGDVTGNNGGYDYWVVKLGPYGNLDWQSCYGGSKSDMLNCIKQTYDGGYVIAGKSKSNDGDVSENYGFFDYWIVKINSAGNIEWQNSYGGSGTDVANSIQEITEGGYIVVGTTDSSEGDITSNNGKLDYWVVILDVSGTIEWQKCYGGSSHEEAYCIQQTSEGYIIAGYTSSNDGDIIDNNGERDYWVVNICMHSPLIVEITDTIYCHSTELTALGDFAEYLWSTGDTTQTITITDGGIYTATGYTEVGCPTEISFNAAFPIEPYDQSQICMVTLDEEIGKNLIVFEPELNVGIDSILFYRLNNQTSEYEWIGSNSINETSTFIDDRSSPNQQNYHYRIAIKDTCSKTSEMSELHRTMLLQANTGINNEVNLFWNAYTGFDYPNFGIYRSVDGGEYFLIANVPNNTFTYTDLTPPTSEKRYQIRVEKDPPCTPQKSTYSFVGSNPVVLHPDGITDNELYNIKVYPNPFDNKLIIELVQNHESMNIELIDVYGRVIDTFVIKSGQTTSTIETGDLLPGVYYLRLDKIVSKRVVKY